MVSRRCLIRKKSIVIVFALFGKKRWQKKEIQGKKSLKIPKGQSVSVFRRRTDNTMAKRKKYKRTTIYKTKDTSKLKKDRQYKDQKKKGQKNKQCSINSTHKLKIAERETSYKQR